MSSDAQPAIPQWSEEGSRRTLGQLKEIVINAGDLPADSIGLHGGLPPPEAFPVTAISVTLADGTVLQLPAALAQRQYDIPPAGLPSLVEWCAKHTKEVHAPPTDVAHTCIATDGSTHALDIATSLFLDPGDTILVEQYTYPHFVDAVLRPKRYRVAAAPMDAQGIIPEALEALLADLDAQGIPAPKLLYTVPTGQNPTSATTPTERRAAIYAICRRRGICILEDDPYVYLQFPNGPDAVPGLTDIQIESYLSMDTDGRVIRLDSFAKCLAPGLRLGWITAAPSVAERFAMAQQARNLGPAMLSQALVAEMMRAWGNQGLDAHLRGVQKAYAQRAAALEAAAAAELAGLAQWASPKAGMFLWLRLLGIEDSKEIFGDMAAAGVVAVPGGAAAADPDHGPCPYVRVSFSHAAPEALGEAVRRMAGVLRARQQNM